MFAVPSRRVLLSMLGGVLVGAALTVVLVDRLLRFDSEAVATGVTLAATIATALATVALAWYGRVQIAAARRQQRGIAASLLEVVRGIRVELGPRAAPGEMQGKALVGKAEVPQIHPWFHRVIPQIAESDPLIIGLFLTLDRQLHDYRAAAQKLHQARVAPIAASFGASPEQTRVATERADGAANAAKIAYSECHKTLDDLEKALGAVLSGG